MGRSAPRLARLTRRVQFQAAAGNGRRFRSSVLTVQVLDRAADDDGIRLGLTASRKCGNAVKRNRIRRRLRAAAREAFAERMAHADVVAVARAETLAAPFDELVRSLRGALTKARAQRKHQPDSPEPGPGISRGRDEQETERS